MQTTAGQAQRCHVDLPVQHASTEWSLAVLREVRCTPAGASRNVSTMEVMQHHHAGQHIDVKTIQLLTFQGCGSR